MPAACGLDVGKQIISIRSKNLRIGQLPDKSKSEARHFLRELEHYIRMTGLLRSRLAQMKHIGKIECQRCRRPNPGAVVSALGQQLTSDSSLEMSVVRPIMDAKTKAGSSTSLRFYGPVGSDCFAIGGQFYPQSGHDSSDSQPYNGRGQNEIRLGVDKAGLFQESA